MEWYLMVWQKFAQFDGRSRRKEYWMFVLFNTVAYVVLYVGLLAAFLAGQKMAGIFLTALLVIYALAALIPGLAVSVRRLHDINKSGWWMLLCLVPFGGLVILILECIEGNPGDNQYGPNPKLLPQPTLG
jgi:uncharacterized membrane protein YhaH (DUF805 family)